MTERDRLEYAWPWLAAAIHRYGETHSKDDVWSLVSSGAAQLWSMPHAAMLTTIEVYPTGLKELRGWLAGGDLHEILEQAPIVEAWAKDQGCTRVSICGRRGWLRAFRDYRDCGTVLTKDI